MVARVALEEELFSFLCSPGSREVASPATRPAACLAASSSPAEAVAIIPRLIPAIAARRVPVAMGPRENMARERPRAVSHIPPHLKSVLPDFLFWTEDAPSGNKIAPVKCASLK